LYPLCLDDLEHHACACAGSDPMALSSICACSCFLRRLASCSLAARSCHGIDAVCRGSRGQGQGRTHGAMGQQPRVSSVRCWKRQRERTTRRATRGEALERPAAGSVVVVVARRTARVLRAGWLAAGCMGLATPTSHLAYRLLYLYWCEVRRHEGDSDVIHTTALTGARERAEAQAEHG